MTSLTPNRRLIPELDQLEHTLQNLPSFGRVDLLATVSRQDTQFPIHAVTLTRSQDPSVPVLVMVGGVHGLERIGSQVLLAHLQTVLEYCRWDSTMQELLTGLKLVFIPLLNPTGVYLESRSNHRGVDLMRNAPLDSNENVSAWHIYRGHRISARLPWFRGERDTPMEVESAALCQFIEEEIFPSRLAVCLDVHSGFGAIDRLWFPYACSRKLFDHAAEVSQLADLFKASQPNLNYVIEPQSLQYTVHGDLWDHLYLKHRTAKQAGLFLPLTLEMGSWSWLRKNPFQFFRRLGLFHPIKGHRVRRVLRRHWPLFDFLARATRGSEQWAKLSVEDRQKAQHKAELLWGSKA